MGKGMEEGDVVVVPTKIKVKRQVRLRRDGGHSETSSSEQVVDVRGFATTPAMATARVGVTMSQAYQSVTVAIEYSIPEYKEFIEEAGLEAYERAKQHVEKELPGMREFLSGLKRF